uniref:Uncharacterized protein n=1 Tax=Caenorhabditis japonica TaxID=281687 RepID=A0A8R1ETG9_CAEJA
FTESGDPDNEVVFNYQENIYVSRARDTRTRTLIVNSTGSITSLSIDPLNRLIFWTTGGPVPRILSAYLDGTPIPQPFKPSSSQPHLALVERNIFDPKSLVIDTPNERIYWIDGFKRTIETVTLDGKDRRTVRKFELGDQPVVMDILGSYIYLVTNQGSLVKMHKFTGKIEKYTQKVRDISPRMKLRIAHPAKHTVSHIAHQKNPCQSSYCPSETVCVPMADVKKRPTHPEMSVRSRQILRGVHQKSVYDFATKTKRLHNVETISAITTPTVVPL